MVRVERVPLLWVQLLVESLPLARCNQRPSVLLHQRAPHGVPQMSGGHYLSCEANSSGPSLAAWLCCSYLVAVFNIKFHGPPECETIQETWSLTPKIALRETRL